MYFTYYFIFPSDYWKVKLLMNLTYTNNEQQENQPLACNMFPCIRRNIYYVFFHPIAFNIKLDFALYICECMYVCNMINPQTKKVYIYSHINFISLGDYCRCTYVYIYGCITKYVGKC